MVIWLLKLIHKPVSYTHLDVYKRQVHSTFHVCWGAQAGLYYHYGIQKHTLSKKMCGIYRHKILTPKSRLFRGFDDAFLVPHSRYTETKAEDIIKNPLLRLMSVSDRSGVHIVGDTEGRQFFVTGHSEYDAETLQKEYTRDLNKGLNPEIPYNYFPDDNPKLKPRNRCV